MKEIDIKKTLSVKRLMMAVAMTACVFSHAFAATPKTESVIMHDRITLGDVFDGITGNADYYLAPAPAIGKSVVLNADDLTRISNAFNLGWVADNAAQHVVIRHQASELNRFDIEPALQKKLSEAMKGQKVDVELADRTLSLRIPVGAERKVDVSDMAFDAAQSTFTAVISSASLPGVQREVKGRFYQISRVPVLKAPSRPGDVITADDIDYIDLRSNEISSSMVVDGERLLGQTPRRGIAAMKPILSADLELPTLVKKGDLVILALKSGAINLTAQGRALNNGAEGDTVRVMNTGSRQVVEGVVTGPQTISIRAPSSALSLNISQGDKS